MIVISLIDHFHKMEHMSAADAAVRAKKGREARRRSPPPPPPRRAKKDAAAPRNVFLGAAAMVPEMYSLMSVLISA